MPYTTYIDKHWAPMLVGPGNCPSFPCVKTALVWYTLLGYFEYFQFK